MTSYDAIWTNLLPKFRSYEVPLMTKDEVRESLHDFIIPAVARFHVCRKDLFKRDDELGCFIEDLDDVEIEIFSNYVLLEYLDSTYIRTPLLLKATLSSSDFNAFSNANHLDKLLAMQERYLSENETLLSRYSWKGGATVRGNTLSMGNKKGRNKRK